MRFVGGMGLFIGTDAERQAYARADAGQRWYATDTDTLWFWAGTAWNRHAMVSGDSFEGNVGVDGAFDWAAGNVTYVPIDGDIQTYVNAAAAGDTLVLASGEYGITSTITINKQLNIVGQGNAGFATAPVTPGHGTLISSATAAVVAFQINHDNVRIAYLSINLTGDTSTAVNTARDLVGVVFSNMDVIVNCTGPAQGFTVYSTDVVMRDLSFYITSSDDTASGVLFRNDAATTRDAVADCWNVTGTVLGAGAYAYAFVCWNQNVAHTLTLNLSNSVCRALAGTPLDVAVASFSVTTFNSVVNAYMSTFDGADWDAYQTGTNQLNLGGSVLANNLIFGTVTYRATMVSGIVTTPSLILTNLIDISGLTSTDFIGPTHILGTAAWGASGEKLLNFVPQTNVNQIFRPDNFTGDSDFVATINNLPGGAAVVYNAPTSGDEECISPDAAALLGKIVLHNTTRGDSALISLVNTGTNTITLTANVPGTWQVGDTITARSQTNLAVVGVSRYFDIDVSLTFGTDVAALLIDWFFKDTGAALEYSRIHPYEAAAASKSFQLLIQVANTSIARTVLIPLVSQRFTFAWTASGAGTALPALKLMSWFEEAAT